MAKRDITKWIFHLSSKVILIMTLCVTPLLLENLHSIETELTTESCGLHEDKVEKLEDFFENKVPGLEVSYREVFDAIIAEGHEIYVKGGVVRDVLSPQYKEPHDVDFMFSSTKEELEEIINKHQWQYTSSPNYSIVVIGDREGIFMEGSPYEKYAPKNEYEKEFTINNIYYHVNARHFILDCDEGFEDLAANRLRVKAQDLEQWLYGSPGYYRYAKLFRVWKMVGKGYDYEARLESFIREATYEAQDDDAEAFFSELREYLANHVEAYDEIANGSIIIMGLDWYLQNMDPLREVIEKEGEETKALLLEYTHYREF